MEAQNAHPSNVPPLRLDDAIVEESDTASGSGMKHKKREGSENETLGLCNSQLMNMSAIGGDEKTPRSIAITAQDNRVMRMPDSRLMFKQQRSLQDMLADIHEDPGGFKEFIDDIRSEMKPHTDVVPSPFDSRCGCLADYSVDESIVVGRGRFSVVHFATRKRDMMPCALKKITWGPAAGEACKGADGSAPKEVSPTKCLKEVGLLRSLQHPNVVLYLDSFLHDSDLYIVLEWAGKGDLKVLISDYRRRNAQLSEGGVWSLFSQCCEAVRHMHEKRIMHRDIKPSNVFIMEDGSLKLGDLGLGRYLDLQSILAFSQVGTPLYMSPEVLRGEGHHFTSDIWSLGCMLFELATLRSPFQEKGLTMDKLFAKIVRGEFRRPSVNSNSNSNSSSISNSNGAVAGGNSVGAGAGATAGSGSPLSPYTERVGRMVESMLTVDPKNRPDIVWCADTALWARRSLEQQQQQQQQRASSALSAETSKHEAAAAAAAAAQSVARPVCRQMEESQQHQAPPLSFQGVPLLAPQQRERTRLVAAAHPTDAEDLLAVPGDAPGAHEMAVPAPGGLRVEATAVSSSSSRRKELEEVVKGEDEGALLLAEQQKRRQETMMAGLDRHLEQQLLRQGQLANSNGDEDGGGPSDDGGQPLGVGAATGAAVFGAGVRLPSRGGSIGAVMSRINEEETVPTAEVSTSPSQASELSRSASVRMAEDFNTYDEEELLLMNELAAEAETPNDQVTSSFVGSQSSVEHTVKKALVGTLDHAKLATAAAAPAATEDGATATIGTAAAVSTPPRQPRPPQQQPSLSAPPKQRLSPRFARARTPPPRPRSAPHAVHPLPTASLEGAEASSSSSSSCLEPRGADSMAHQRLHESVDSVDVRRHQAAAAAAAAEAAEAAAAVDALSAGTVPGHARSSEQGATSQRSVRALGSAFVSGMLPRRRSQGRVHVFDDDRPAGRSGGETCELT